MSNTKTRRQEEGTKARRHEGTKEGGAGASSRLRFFAVNILLGSLFGCTVGPDYQQPNVAVPQEWIDQQHRAAVDVSRWWKTFNDPALDSLTGRAIDANLDLRLATARLKQVRATRAVAAADLWPAVDSSGSYRRAGGGKIEHAEETFRAGFDASWELDVFGGVRRSVEAADVDIEAAVEDRRDVLVALVAEVASTYIDLRTTQRRIDIANKNLIAQKKSFDLTRRRQEGGFVSGLDVANAEALVASTQSQIPLLESSAYQSMYALATLLGREPGALIKELEKPGAIPAMPAKVPAGLPSDLLKRRPDVRRIEAELHAATARIGVATADLYPRFLISGSLSVSGDRLGSLFNWSSRGWGLGPSISWPVFDAGRIRATIAARSSIQEQILISYEQSILRALQEVESSLIAYTRERTRQESLRAALAANTRAEGLALRLYNEGKTGFIDVLNAQRSLLSSEDSLAVSERNLATQLISLYKALGGGWEWEQTAAPSGK